VDECGSTDGTRRLRALRIGWAGRPGLRMALNPVGPVHQAMVIHIQKIDVLVTKVKCIGKWNGCQSNGLPAGILPATGDVRRRQQRGEAVKEIVGGPVFLEHDDDVLNGRNIGVRRRAAYRANQCNAQKDVENSQIHIIAFHQTCRCSARRATCAATWRLRGSRGRR